MRRRCGARTGTAVKKQVKNSWSPHRVGVIHVAKSQSRGISLYLWHWVKYSEGILPQEDPKSSET